MAGTQPQSAAAGVWNELESLARRDAGERAYVERLLELWRDGVGALGAALYLERDGGAEAGLDLPGRAEIRVQAGRAAEGSTADGRGSEGTEVDLLRELVAGEGPFPASLGSAPADLWTWRMPGGLVAARPPAASGTGAGSEPAPAAPEPLSLLLASALRAYRLRRQLKQQHFRVNYRVVELESVYEVGLAIASTLDLDQLSDEILLRALSLLDARRVALYRREGPIYRLDRAFGGDARDGFPADDPALEPLLAGAGSGPEGEDGGRVLPGARHLMAVAIGTGDRPRGLIVVGDKESRRGVGPFGASDRRTLSLFANQAAIALENARLHRQALEKERLEREMELAAEIQRQILPKGAPALEGWELVGWNRPARQVGGDYYDLVARDGRLTFTVADVTGKGIAAALMVSTLHSALHLLIDRVGINPELFERLNQHILESSARNKFITLLLADLDGTTGELRYVNAGHNPGVLVRSGGAESGGGNGVVQLDSSGLPLGLMALGGHRVESVRVEPGDLLCLYTDGITECAAPDDEEFGLERLVEILVQMREAPLAEVVAHLDRETTTFAAGQPQGDDQTVILLRRRAA